MSLSGAVYVFVPVSVSGGPSRQAPVPGLLRLVMAQQRAGAPRRLRAGMIAVCIALMAVIASVPGSRSRSPTARWLSVPRRSRSSGASTSTRSARRRAVVARRARRPARAQIRVTRRAADAPFGAASPPPLCKRPPRPHSPRCDRPARPTRCRLHCGRSGRTDSGAGERGGERRWRGQYREGCRRPRSGEEAEGYERVRRPFRSTSRRWRARVGHSVSSRRERYAMRIMTSRASTSARMLPSARPAASRRSIASVRVP